MSLRIMTNLRNTGVRSLALGYYCLAARTGRSTAWTTTTTAVRRSYATTTTALAATPTATPTFPTWTFDEACPAMEWTSVVPTTLGVAAASRMADVDADLVVIGVMAPPKDDEEEDDASDDDDDDDSDPVVPPLTGIAAELDIATGGALTAVLVETAKTFKFGAKVGAATHVVQVVNAAGQTTRFAFLGLGPTPTQDSDDSKQDPAAGLLLGKAVAMKCKAQAKVTSCQVLLPATLADDATLLTDVSTAFYQTLYIDNRFKTKAKQKKIVPDLKSVTILSEGSKAVCDAAVLERGRQIAEGVTLAKDIVNAPHNVLNSESLAETAQRVADASDGRLTCTILDKAACEARGMGAYLGVARGSETEPQFIHLTYTPPSSSTVHKKIAVIGKGLLFDTGGYNIKTSMMEAMKFDCGGAAAVLGAARAVAMTAPEGVEAHFIVAACENMINAKAMVPSDILTAMNGKTIEVMNTDAEGRLTLADALVYADKEVGAESIIELSTLTGACMVSLGKQIAGVWTTNDDLASELESISKVTADKTWRMPMAMEYKEQLESTFADMKNIGTRYGGAITAALFLTNFVSPKKPFAHIDIAGPVWNDKTGATGFGAKLVVEWVRRQGIKKE